MFSNKNDANKHNTAPAQAQRDNVANAIVTRIRSDTFVKY